MTLRRIVLLNDTDFQGQHFGCQRVMRTIRDNLKNRNAQILDTVPVGMPWHLMSDKMEKIKNSEMVVINGEGTLHHGKRKGKWLLEAAQFARESGAKVALINALWQDNPEDWAEIAGRIDHIWCRDSRSARDLSKATGRDIPWLGDLSLCSGAEAIQRERSNVISVGDSVHGTVTKKLAELSLELDETSISPLMTNFKYISPDLKGIRKRLRIIIGELLQGRFERRFGIIDFATDEWDYLNKLSHSQMLITGRFHAVCMAVTTATPFVGIKSNSWKIEMLLEDIGLSKGRLLCLDGLDAESLQQKDWNYSKEETVNIAARLKDWKLKSAAMFDEIAGV